MYSLKKIYAVSVIASLFLIVFMHPTNATYSKPIALPASWWPGYGGGYQGDGKDEDALNFINLPEARNLIHDSRLSGINIALLIMA